MGRSCARPACSGSATTTLSYDYANATVWIEPLQPEAHPMHHDLCARHAGRLSVPRGWTLVDRRTAQAAAPAVDEPGPPLAPTASVTDTWDPSGIAQPDPADTSAPADDPVIEDRTGDESDDAVLFEPTLFSDWMAGDDRQSLAS